MVCQLSSESGSIIEPQTVEECMFIPCQDRFTFKQIKHSISLWITVYCGSLRQT